MMTFKQKKSELNSIVSSLKPRGEGGNGRKEAKQNGSVKKTE